MALTTEIQNQIDHTLQQQPVPVIRIIKKIHSNKKITIETREGVLSYVSWVGGEPFVGNQCLLIFCNRSFNEYIAVC